jgi:formate hydrogenlyase subunit 3/multisubunit Na+/H+ antiporter MnhD subunit
MGLDHGWFMSLAGLDGALLAGAVWGLAAAMLIPALAALAPNRSGSFAHTLGRVIAMIACGLVAALGVRLLAGGTPVPLAWWPGLPGEPFVLAPDALAGPFVLLLGVVGAFTFAVHVPSGSLAGARARLALHAAFALALLAVFTARHALLFLVAWEGMTLASAALVASDPASARARQAAYVYLAISHVGAALVAAGLLTLAGHAGAFDFDSLARAWAALPPNEAAALGWTFTAGFAIKLGLVPAHVWLPMAHPEAPGPISALLSGVMVKAGLYGLLRFAWQMPGAPPAHWGTVLMLLGVASALAGALYAAVEADAKRLLAHSTLEHAGVLALALGLAATLAANGQPATAGLALAAVLYHAVGHGFAKALAFASVSEATHAAGSRNLEALGGLARRMPRTALAALVAALALCVLPPLSCFAGEWLVFQALILGYASGAGQLRLLAPFAGAGLALATALAVAALVKLYGIGFLGRARSEGADAARDVAPGVGRALVAFSLLPLAWGLAAPTMAIVLARPLVALLPGYDPGTLTRDAGFTLSPLGSGAARVSPAATALLLVAFAALARLWLRTSRGRAAEPRRGPSWSGGTPLAPRMQYSALGFTKPLRLIFEPVLRPERELEVLEEGSPYFARRVRYRSGIPAVFEQYLYQPLVQSVLWASERIRRLQAGHLHLYLAYLLATLVALLLWAR